MIRNEIGCRKKRTKSNDAESNGVLQKEAGTEVERESTMKMNEWKKKIPSARICNRLRNIACVYVCAVVEYFSLQFMFHDHASYIALLLNARPLSLFLDVFSA